MTLSDTDLRSRTSSMMQDLHDLLVVHEMSAPPLGPMTGNREMVEASIRAGALHGTRLMAEYAERFAGDVESLVAQYKARGLRPSGHPDMFSSPVTLIGIADVIDALSDLAVGLEGPRAGYSAD